MRCLACALNGVLVPSTGERGALYRAAGTVDQCGRGGTRAVRPLHRCTTVAAEDREHARCPHRHIGTHFLTPADATVTMVDSHTVRIVESCGASNAHTDQGPDPYILWFVAGAPSHAPDIAQTCPGTVSHPFPYAVPYFGQGIPNPNNPDPTGAYDIVTRHWAGPSVSYRVNTPTGSNATTNIFASVPGSLLHYTFGQFHTDIQNILDDVNELPNVGLHTQIGSITTTNWEASVAGNVPLFGVPAAFPAMNGNFIWDANCGGPTGDGVNEFIFLRNPHHIFPGGGMGAGGLASTLMDVSTGQILECDVIFQTGSTAAGWGTPSSPYPGPQHSTAFAHEIGHFFGLDHTNLHHGSGASPTASSLIAFPNISAIPAMAGTYLMNDPAGRVLAPPNYASPWRSDDIAGLASLYPVRAMNSPPATLKRHAINDCASITGTIVDASGTLGMYALNVFLIPMPAAGSNLSPGAPVVGTISGTARLGPNDVTGLRDSTLFTPSSGRFRIDGIPMSVTSSITRYAIVVEPMSFVSIPQGSFGEWWSEPVINPIGFGNGLNLWPTTVTTNAVLINNLGAALSGTGGTVQVGSIDMMPGSVINLAKPILAGTGVQVESVSRPLVKLPASMLQMNPQASTNTINGGVESVTVFHNFGVTPLKVSAVIRSGATTLVFAVLPTGTTTGNTNGLAAWSSTFNVTMPASISPGSVFQFRATEMSGTVATVTGMSEARY